MAKLTNETRKMIISAMFLATAMILPLLFGQIQEIGKALCPMHIPIMLCGYICGHWYGAVVGLVSPILRLMFFGMPPLFPNGFAMCFEGAAYGFVCGFLYKVLPKKSGYIYVTLISAMIIGRAVWGTARGLLLGFKGIPFGIKIFVAEGFVTALPGIAIQVVVVPFVVMALKNAIPKLNEFN